MVGPHSGLQEVSMFSAEVTLELAVEGRGLPFRAGVKAIQVEGQAPSKAWRTGKRCPVRGSRVPSGLILVHMWTQRRRACQRSPA